MSVHSRRGALILASSAALNLTDVDRVVLGGAYAPLVASLRPGIERHVQQRVLSARWSPVIVEGALGGQHAAGSGAALRVLEDVVADPTPWLRLLS